MATPQQWTAMWDLAKGAVNQYNSENNKSYKLREVLDESTMSFYAPSNKTYVFKQRILFQVDDDDSGQKTCSATVKQTWEGPTCKQELENFNFFDALNKPSV